MQQCRRCRVARFCGMDSQRGQCGRVSLPGALFQSPAATAASPGLSVSVQCCPRGTLDAGIGTSQPTGAAAGQEHKPECLPHAGRLSRASCRQ